MAFRETLRERERKREREMCSADAAAFVDENDAKRAVIILMMRSRVFEQFAIFGIVYIYNIVLC